MRRFLTRKYVLPAAIVLLVLSGITVYAFNTADEQKQQEAILNQANAEAAKKEQEEKEAEDTPVSQPSQPKKPAKPIKPINGTKADNKPYTATDSNGKNETKKETTQEQTIFIVQSQTQPIPTQLPQGRVQQVMYDEMPKLEGIVWEKSIGTYVATLSVNGASNKYIKGQNIGRYLIQNLTKDMVLLLDSESKKLTRLAAPQ